jgi:hypothetical protein
MQRLSRVKNVSGTNWGRSSAMIRRPGVAVRIAQFIADWSEAELHLGQFLGFLLHANEPAALAMYSATDNRSAQIRMITAAAHASLDQDTSDIFDVIMTHDVRPMMKCRDKLAHWTWGYTDDIADALLIMDPSNNLRLLSQALRGLYRDAPLSADADYDNVYVITEKDMIRMLKRLAQTQDRLSLLMQSVWERVPLETRASKLSQLSSLPHIQRETARLREGRKNTPAVQPQSLDEEPSGRV